MGENRWEKIDGKGRIVELEMVVIIGDNITFSYLCPHCCAEGKMIQEKRPGKQIPLIAKGILEYEGIKSTCGNCGEPIVFTGGDVIKNTLRSWLNHHK